MHRLYSLSKLPLQLALGCCTWLLPASCTDAAIVGLKAYDTYDVLPANESDRQDVKWAAYLSSHLTKRTKDAAVMTAADGGLKILVDADADSYSWEWADATTLTLHARNNEQMLWLLYQAMTSIGQADHRFEVMDLPPASVNLGVDGRGSMAFEHRSLYTPTNTNTDLMPILGAGNVDFDWGLWGHNLHKVTGDNLPQEVYALSDGKRNPEQYCFSSEELYRRIETFVSNAWGDNPKDGGTRFLVMPNDNDIVCRCALCKAAGNTATSATPALSALVARLARRFPAHIFFTSSYLTAKEPPTRAMPGNVGVVVSAMDMPLTTKPDESTLTPLIKRWQKTVNRIYVWDYIRNFDDYLSPFPVLGVARARLQYFRRMGVKGIICNGSGTDFAAFDDMQTFVLSALMLNPDADVEPLVRAYFAKFYPATGTMLADYYLGLEKRVADNTAGLPYYGGIEDEMKAYLDPTEFFAFTQKLEKASKKVTGEERKQLNKLLTGFNYTRLEMMRTPKVRYEPDKAATYLENLMGHRGFSDMENYRESDGALAEYVAAYASPLSQTAGTGLKCTGDPMLTDGYIGAAHDYHTNWFITREPVKTLHLTTPKAGTLRIGLLHAPAWHIFAPQRVELWQGGRMLASVPVGACKPARCRVTCEVNARKLSVGKPFELRLIQQTGTGKITLGCDEVELLQK